MSARLPIHDRLGLERGAVVVERLGSGYVRLSVVEPDGATPSPTSRARARCTPSGE